MLLPTDEPFAEDLMDYWGIGAEVAVLPVGVKAGVHPVEIADAVLGFFFIDVTGADLQPVFTAKNAKGAKNGNDGKRIPPSGAKRLAEIIAHFAISGLIIRTLNRYRGRSGQ